jgi:very-short-patch-repair endonuclease
MRTPRPRPLPTEPTSLPLLESAGCTRQMVRTQVASGRLVRVRHGVFVAAGAWPADAVDQHLVRARAELVVHPDAVISHGSAALVWRLPHPGPAEWHDAPPSVTLPRGGGARSGRGPATHHVGSLPPSQVTRDGKGYAVTTVARTAVDLACSLSLPEQLVLLDAAGRRLVESLVAGQARRVDYLRPSFVSAAMEPVTAAALSRRPCSLARAISLTVPARESVAESLSAGHLHLAGLAAPEFQHRIRTSQGDVFPDFYWPGLNLVGEVDGKVKYADPTAYEREKMREQALRDLGYRMVRWTAREIMLSPDVVVERVARALGV